MGIISAVKRFEIHDGPGVRTTLFLKGCPLECRWCHNPEGIRLKPEVLYTQKNCIGCGECARICGCHEMGPEGHRFERSGCVGCGRCEEICLGEALRFYGREVSPEEILPELLEDRAFFGPLGGVTLSGGEPLLQPEFTAELLRLLKQEGIHTAVDTCGYGDAAALEQVIPYADLFLYDIKAIDEEAHIRGTGRSNKKILENLRLLDERGCAIEVRYPLIPGYNDREAKAIGAFLSGLRHPVVVKVLPYHNYAGSKYDGLERRMEEIEKPSEALVEDTLRILASFGLDARDGRK